MMISKEQRPKNKGVTQKEFSLTEKHGDVQLVLPVNSPLYHHDVDGVQHRSGQRPQGTFREATERFRSVSIRQRERNAAGPANVTYGALVVRVFHAGEAHQGHAPHARQKRAGRTEQVSESRALPR